MYRKEMCPSLLRDPDSNEHANENEANKDDKPEMRWHKVSILH